MLSNIIFRAQPLDNTSDNYVEINEVQVMSGDAAKIGYASEKISNVNNEKNIILKEGDVEIIIVNNKILITVPTEQKDSFGRSAPFLCYFEFLRGIDTNLISQEAVQKIQKFTQRIGRNLTSDAPITLQNQIKEALERNDSLLSRKLPNSIGCVVVGAAVLTATVAVSALALHHITTK